MTWRVFFIGPMGKAYADRLPRLRDYFVNRLVTKHGYESRKDENRGGGVRMKKGDDEVIAITPSDEHLRADIPTNIFHQIDNADLIVADLTANRKTVFYELAMAHALGTETSLLVSKGKSESDIYLAQFPRHRVDFRSEPWDCPSFDESIDRWVSRRQKRQRAQNPLSNFYGAPLLDISAASGLAVGYCDNFVRPILVSGTIVEQHAAGDSSGARGETKRDVQGLIVARPDRLSIQIADFEAELSQALGATFGDRFQKAERGRLFVGVDERDGSSRIPFFVVDDYVIDIPRTMFSTKHSRRLSRLKERLESWGQEPVIDLNMESVLIDGFFTNLKSLVKERILSTMGYKGTEFHMGTADELPEIIRTGHSSTFVG